MAFRPRAVVTGSGRHLEWKVRLFFVAAALLVVGMAREQKIFVLVAIGVLAVAFVLRFFEGPAPAEEADDEEADEQDDDYAAVGDPPDRI
jgi:uncharacterized membrane protein